MKTPDALISQPGCDLPEAAGSSLPSCSAPQKAFEPQAKVPVQPVDPSQKNLSLAKWCANLVTLVFRSRTSFAAFARASIHLSRSDSISTSPAFPVPLPCFGVFDRMPSDLSATRRAKLHFRRALCACDSCFGLLVEWQ